MRNCTHKGFDSNFEIIDSVNFFTQSNHIVCWILHLVLGLLKNKEGDYCDNPEESLNILLNTFFPGHTSVPDTDIMDFTMVKNARLDKTFTIKKVKAAFSYMGSFKLAGPDGIKPIVMKHFSPKALGCITKLFQAIYSTGVAKIKGGFYTKTTKIGLW